VSEIPDAERRGRPPGAGVREVHDPALEARLADMSDLIRAGHRDVRNLEAERIAAIHQALADGWTHAQIARATGLTRGRVGQIAAHGVQR